MRPLILLSLLFSLFACANQSNEAEGAQNPLARTDEQMTMEKAMFDSVMAVHDAVMPEMSTINRIKRNLKGILNEGTELTEEDRKTIEKLVVQLENAEEGMMSWMRNFGSIRLDSMPYAKAMNQLQSEEKNIAAVKHAMENAIQKGQEVLSNFENH